MAQIDKLKKSLEAIRVFQTPSKIIEKNILPMKYLRQEIYISKKDCILHCNVISDIIGSASLRANNEFSKLLSLSLELLLSLCNNDDSDIRNASTDSIDKIISSLYEFHTTLLINEFLKEIKRNSSSRSLRVALIRFSDLCALINPKKYRPYVANFYISVVDIINRSDDELLQDVLQQSVSKIFPLLTYFALDKEINLIFNAYLNNLKSSSTVVRRCAALSIVILCENTTKSDQYFILLLNNLLNLLFSQKISENENFEQLFSGVFMVLKFLSSKISKFLIHDEDIKAISNETREMMVEKLYFLYQHLITSIKYSTSNLVIISSLETLIEFYSTIHFEIYHKFALLYENNCEFKVYSCSNNLEHQMDNKIFESNLSISSSINYIEDINEELEEVILKNTGISLFDTQSIDTKVDCSSEALESELDYNIDIYSETYFDKEIDYDISYADKQTPDIDVHSDCSSVISNRKSQLSHFDHYTMCNDPIDCNNIHQISFDNYDLGQPYSLENTSKLICLKYLLKGLPNELINDEDVRVSVKTLALSCIASIVHIYPQSLLFTVKNNQDSQYILDIILYAKHSDPNLKGGVAKILGYFLNNIFSLPFSYKEFLLQNNFDPNNSAYRLDTLLNVLCDILNDSSSISVKHSLLSFQQFLSKIFNSTEVHSEFIFELIENLIYLRNSSYWLVKVELVNLICTIPFIHLTFLEEKRSQNILNSENKVYDQSQQSISVSQIIVEKILFYFIFDQDHRVRKATIKSLKILVEKLCICNYIFNNDSVNYFAFESMKTNFCCSYNSKTFNGLFPEIGDILSPLDHNNRNVESKFSLSLNENLKRFNSESNLLFFVNRFFYEICHHFESKSVLNGSIAALSELALAFPPRQYLNGWGIDFELNEISENAHEFVGKINFFLDLLTKNQVVMLDLATHQSLINVIINLFEAVVCAYIKIVKNNNDKFSFCSESDLIKQLSPNFNSCIEQFFTHLFKIIVAYAAIAENNSAIFTTFVHNLYTRRFAQTTSILKRRSTVIFANNDKNTVNSDDLSNKGAKRQEAQTFDPSYFELYELLKSHHRTKRNLFSNKIEKTSFLNVIMNSLSRLLEISEASFLCNHLEDLLEYLKIIFYLAPSSVICSVKQLLKCIFGVNYLSLFFEVYNQEKNLSPNSKPSQLIESGGCKSLKIADINSLYNTCVSLPYIGFNDFYNSYNSNERVPNHVSTYLSWLQKWIKFKYLKIMNDDFDRIMIQDVSLKKYIANKIRNFDSFLILSVKHYLVTSDSLYQSQVLDLLTLVQFNMNYSKANLNIFINFLLNQLESFGGVHDSKRFESLSKRSFYFLASLSRQPYVNSQLISIPKLIQQCDEFIASGHHQLALDGLYIIIDNVFYNQVELENADQHNPDLDTQREVIIAYCFKLTHFSQSFELLLLVVNYYKKYNATKWEQFSLQIMNVLSNRLLQTVIKLHTKENFECMQTLLFSLCPNIFSKDFNLTEHLFSLFENNCHSTSPNLWLANILLYLKLTLFNMNESMLLTSISNSKSKILKIVSNFTKMHSFDNALEESLESIESPKLFAYFLLITLKSAVVDLYNNLTTSHKQKNYDISVYLMSNYNLTITFIFQSGFYPKLTNAAMQLIKYQTQTPFSELNIDICALNQTFTNVSKFYPTITVSWLNLLYILNYEKLPEILSDYIKANSPLNVNVTIYGIHCEVIKRCSLILLCDFLSENLENVEFSSWLIINHLKEIIELCNELPIKEFINAIHRKSSSSGLFLQAIQSRCNGILTNPVFANKILECLKRAHHNQSRAMVVFLLEKYLFNDQLICYYKCCKYAEIIISSRLMMIYDVNIVSSGNKSTYSDNQFSADDINNLLCLLKKSPYSKLYITVKTIKDKFFLNKCSRKELKIKDPLSEECIIASETNKIWFLSILEQFFSLPQKKTSNIVQLLDKLSNDDIITLISSEDFCIENFEHVLIFIAEKINEHEHKSKIILNHNRIELLNLVIPICVQYMQTIVHKLSLQEYKSFQYSDIAKFNVHSENFNLAISFLKSFDCIMNNVSLFEQYANLSSISENKLDIDLFISYTLLVYNVWHSGNFIRLIDLLQLIKNCLYCEKLFSVIAQPNNINVQSILINCIHFISHKYYDYPWQVQIPSKLIPPNNVQIEPGQILNDCAKMIIMFHHVENKSSSNKDHHIPKMFHILVEDIILKLASLPLVNSLVYIPFNFFKSNDNFWNGLTFSGTFGTEIPIIPAQFLFEIDLFRQFSFRICSIGFLNRVQFEEIWMTLLGVFSDELTAINQSVNKEDINDHIQLIRLVIDAITNLLYNAKSKSRLLKDNMLSVHSKRSNHFFGTKFDFIKTRIDKKIKEIEKSLLKYNATKPRNQWSYQNYIITPLEKLKENIRTSDFSPLESPESRTTSLAVSIDLYSCTYFLIDLYHQTVKSHVDKNVIYFPILSQIAKSCICLSDMFVEEGQYKQMLDLLLDLSKLAELYEDDILNQYVILGLAKAYSVLSTPIEFIEKWKKSIIEQDFKDFFLPLRIGAIRSIKYLSKSPKIITNKDFIIIFEYISKHLSADVVIPSSYCKQYVEELWDLLFILVDGCNEITLGNSQFDKIFNGLFKILSKNSSSNYLKVIHRSLEQLLYSNKISIKEATEIKNIALTGINSSNNRLNTIYMLNLIFCSSYLVGPPNLNSYSENHNELFNSMEQISTLFEPLKWCNSLEADDICQVLGHFLTDFFPAQDILNKCIGEFLSNQQNHYKYLSNILFVIFNKFQNDFQHNDTAQDWVILSLSSFTQLIPISRALWALTCFLICASQNHWIRASYPYFQHRLGQFDKRDKEAFFAICNSFYNEIKTEENKAAFVKTFQKAACLPNSPYFEILKHLCDI